MWLNIKRYETDELILSIVAVFLKGEIFLLYLTEFLTPRQGFSQYRHSLDAKGLAHMRALKHSTYRLSEIYSFKVFAASLRYTEHATVLSCRGVLFSKHDKSTVFIDQSPMRTLGGPVLQYDLFETRKIRLKTHQKIHAFSLS